MTWPRMTLRRVCLARMDTRRKDNGCMKPSIEKRLQAAKSMRNLSNEIRSPATRMVSTDGALARIAEAIAVLLEELP